MEWAAVIELVLSKVARFAKFINSRRAASPHTNTPLGLILPYTLLNTILENLMIRVTLHSGQGTPSTGSFILLNLTKKPVKES